MESDTALALSVFTHLPLNHIRLCLWQLATVMKPRGVLYPTVFRLSGEPLSHPRQLVQDPYHYAPSDLRRVAKQTGWQMRWIGSWGHPRGQQMVQFTRQQPDGDAAVP